MRTSLIHVHFEGAQEVQKMFHGKTVAWQPLGSKHCGHLLSSFGGIYQDVFWTMYALNVIESVIVILNVCCIETISLIWHPSSFIFSCGVHTSTGGWPGTRSPLASFLGLYLDWLLAVCNTITCILNFWDQIWCSMAAACGFFVMQFYQMHQKQIWRSAG